MFFNQKYYQNIILSPTTLVQSLCDGGLGLLCVKVRAQAHLIFNFIQQAMNPKFQTNLYLNVLFRWYVLEEKDLPEPLCPPYYSKNFLKPYNK